MKAVSTPPACSSEHMSLDGSLAIEQMRIWPHPKQIHTCRLHLPGGLLALIRQQQQQATEDLPNFWRELKVESRPDRSQDTLPSRLCRVLTEGTFAPETMGRLWEIGKQPHRFKSATCTNPRDDQAVGDDVQWWQVSHSVCWI